MRRAHEIVLGPHYLLGNIFLSDTIQVFRALFVFPLRHAFGVTVIGLRNFRRLAVHNQITLLYPDAAVGHFTNSG